LIWLKIALTSARLFEASAFSASLLASRSFSLLSSSLIASRTLRVLGEWLFGQSVGATDRAVQSSGKFPVTLNLSLMEGLKRLQALRGDGPHGATELDTLGSGDLEAGTGALLDEGTLELGHGDQDVHDQATRGILFARVDGLGGADQRDAVGIELENELGEVRKAAAQAVEFHAEKDVDAAPAHVGHELVEPSAGELGAGNGVRVLGGDGPAFAGAVLLKFEALGVG
jgi:hypothetical protein